MNRLTSIMCRTRNLVALVVAALGLLAWSRPAVAQGTDLTSSMTASCATPGCSEALFTLNLEGEQYVQSITLQSTSPLWRFGGLIGVVGSMGSEVFDWIPMGAGTTPAPGIQLSALNNVPYTGEPITFRVQMQPQAAGLTTDDLNHSILYSGKSFDDPITEFPPPIPNSFGGTVTPEPSTWLLLCTGLFGLALFRRRRPHPEQELQTQDC